MTTKSACADCTDVDINSLPALGELNCRLPAPTFICIYLHFVWATWDRLPLIEPDMEVQLYACIAQSCTEKRCKLIAIGGTDNHIHALVRIRAVICAADIIKDMKGASSHLMTHVLAPNTFFKWQGAYGAFSVTPDGVEDVRAYVLNQKEHHANNTLWPNWEQCIEAEDEATSN